MDKMQEQQRISEMVSALADGQLRGDAFAQGIAVATGDAAAREAWQTYHLIGDVLRSGEHAAATKPAQFMSRLQVRLQAEKQVFVTQVAAPVRPQAAALPAANDSSFRWKLVAGLASVTAAAAIGWTVLAGSGTKPDQGQVAAAVPVPPGAVLTGTERGVMLRDPQLDEFLAAHRQLGGASALQMPAGFLRNATFEGASR